MFRTEVTIRNFAEYLKKNTPESFCDNAKKLSELQTELDNFINNISERHELYIYALLLTIDINDFSSDKIKRKDFIEGINRFMAELDKSILDDKNSHVTPKTSSGWDDCR